MHFEDLSIIDPILKALKKQNYSEPTSIQSKTIPTLLKGRDVLASAQTGTGKTAAFAIPIIQMLEMSPKTQENIKALVLTPTRELAIQIGESFSTYGEYCKPKSTVIFGGVNQKQQTDSIKKGVDILIATPGRLLDLINQGYVSLNEIKFFVLDEADRMLDMGFINDIKKIIAKLPSKRQSLFFSATMPESIVELSSKILTKPEKIAVDPVSSTAETIKQFVYFTNKSSKKDLLHHILKNRDLDQVLVFDRTKHGADRVVRDLKKKNIAAAAIHGDKAQNQRQKALSQFKEKQIRVLVATDIAARGIDIDKLAYVINFDIPNVAETYVHRIGRSGRAGKQGVAISLCEPEENQYWKDIEKLIGKTVEEVKDNPFPQTDKPMTAAEKKEFEKEKQKRKQEFFANRKKKSNKRN